MNDESDQFPMGTKKLLNLSKGRSPLQKNVILGKIPKERTPPNQPAGLTSDQKFHENIARGTTDPGYRVYNLNYLFNYIEFVFILALVLVQILTTR